MNFGDLIDENDTRKSCNTLLNDGFIELSGREYMLTARVYEKVKNDVDYTRGTEAQYYFCLPWKYLSVADVRVRDEGARAQSGAGGGVRHRFESLSY